MFKKILFSLFFSSSILLSQGNFQLFEEPKKYNFKDIVEANQSLLPEEEKIKIALEKMYKTNFFIHNNIKTKITFDELRKLDGLENSYFIRNLHIELLDSNKREFKIQELNIKINDKNIISELNGKNLKTEIYTAEEIVSFNEDVLYNVLYTNIYPETTKEYKSFIKNIVYLKNESIFTLKNFFKTTPSASKHLESLKKEPINQTLNIKLNPIKEQEMNGEIVFKFFNNLSEVKIKIDANKIIPKTGISSLFGNNDVYINDIEVYLNKVNLNKEFEKDLSKEMKIEIEKVKNDLFNKSKEKFEIKIDNSKTELNKNLFIYFQDNVIPFLLNDKNKIHFKIIGLNELEAKQAMFLVQIFTKGKFDLVKDLNKIIDFKNLLK